MAIYDNSVLEAKLSQLLSENLELRSLMTIDDTLKQSAGLTKTVNKYSYSGAVEALDAGDSNTVTGSVTMTPETYTVKRYQQTFTYNDADLMSDEGLLDAALTGATSVMSSQIKDEYYSELKKISNYRTMSAADLTYDDVVDALGDLDRVVEDDLFIIMGLDGRNAIRHDADFIAARQGEIMYTGQFGTLCGIPVIFTNRLPDTWVVITTKAAVKFFVKKDASVEQDRNIETKDNTVVYERHGLIALVDDSSSIIMGYKPLELTVSQTGGVVTATGKLDSSNSYVYSISPTSDPAFGSDVSAWTALTASALTVTSGDVIGVAEKDSSGRCVSYGKVTV